VTSTSELDSQIAARREILDWFAGPLGCSLRAAETDCLRSLLPALYANRVLQIGALGHSDLFESCAAPSRTLLELPQVGRDCSLYALPEALPIQGDTQDLVVLPHTLDFAGDPHQVLREVERVLVPEGRVVIAGFNPLSLWGLWRFFRKGRRRQRAPWNAQFISLHRIKDWLKLLDFEVSHGDMLYYRPPLAGQNARDRLYILDKVGNRWWPMMAAVYILVAKKRVAGITPVDRRWRLKGLVPTGAAQAATRDAMRPAARQAGND
jgi:SAM-dependent methyltransferase